MPSVVLSHRVGVSAARLRGRRGRARILITPAALREPRENVRWTVAHELGHFAQRSWSLVAVVAGLVSAPGLAAASVAASSQIMSMLSVVAGAALILLGCALSRRAEREADAFALDLLTLAYGGIPEGLRPLAPCEHPTGLVYLIATHPRTCERLARIDAAARRGR